MSRYSCAICGGLLAEDRWVYSRHTGSRYHWPGECRRTRKGASRRPISGQPKKEPRRQSAQPISTRSRE